MRTILPTAFFLIFLAPLSLLGGSEEKGKIVLETSVSNSSPYVGQNIELTYSLLFSATAPTIVDLNQPLHQGLWAKEKKEDRMMPSMPVTRGERQYRRAVIKTMQLVPLQTGKLSVTGYRVLCTIPEEISLDRDPLNHDSLIVTAPAAVLDIQPLPLPAPPSFSGAVGRVEIERTTSRDSIKENQTAVITTIISGNGNIRTMREPSLLYPETLGLLTSETTRGDTLSIRQEVMAKKAGSVTIPSVKITYFDPEQNTYATAASSPFVLTILPAASPAGSFPETMHRDSLDGYQNRTMVPFQIIGAGLVVLTILIVISTLLKPWFTGLKKARALQKESHSPAASFADSVTTTGEIRRSLYEELEKIITPHPRAMTCQKLSEALSKAGMTEETLKELLSLLDALDMADFSPGKKNTNETEQLRKRAEKLTLQLRCFQPSR